MKPVRLAPQCAVHLRSAWAGEPDGGAAAHRGAPELKEKLPFECKEYCIYTYIYYIILYYIILYYIILYIVIVLATSRRG